MANYNGRYIGFSPDLNFKVNTKVTGFWNLNSQLNIFSRSQIPIEYLIVAGGGGGGSPFSAGGGGAGGYLLGSLTNIKKTNTLVVTVGSGGAVDASGQPSVISGLGTAIGGGYGGRRDTNLDAAPGGSGGGGAGGTGPNSPGTSGGSATPGQGNPGAPGQPGFCNDFNPDFNACNNFGTGSSGGGGGSGSSASGATAGSGSLNPRFSSFGTLAAGGRGDAPAPAGTNTGNGGGKNTAGASGVVILRYPDKFDSADIITGIPEFSVSGGFKYYKFTSSGSITF